LGDFFWLAPARLTICENIHKIVLVVVCGDYMKKINVTFFIHSMTIGGSELVLLRTLQKLEKCQDIKLSVVLHKSITEPFFIEYFQKHTNIKLYVIYKWYRLFDIKDKISVFPLNQIYKFIINKYKRWRRFVLRQTKLFKETDVFIDYRNLESIYEISIQSRPVIGWFHGSINYFNNSGCLKRTKRLDKLVCLTDSFVSDFKQMYPGMSDKILRIYNPIDINAIRKAVNEAEHFSGKYFCVVSRQDTDKDIETTIHAFEQFYQNENKPDVKLLLVGAGPLTPTLKEIARKQESANNIIFTGSVTNPFGYMYGAMANILSSYNEGLPTVLIEAQALGVLNISSDCKSGPREILMDGDAGLLFEPGNAAELAQHMSDVYNNRIDTQTMIQNATDGLVRFRADTVSKQIISLIKSVTKD